MGKVRISGLASLAILASALVGCSPTGAMVSPSVASAPTGSAEPLFATAAASPVIAAAVLEVLCDGIRTDIPTPIVRTQPDGVHIHFANTSGRTLDFGLDDAFGGETLPAPGGSFVYTFGPGSYRLGCGETRTAFAVVDPDRLYKPAECDGGSGTTGTNDYGERARGPRGPLLDVARMELRGLEPGDFVEQAGYPQATGDQLVRVVRGGEVVAVIGYIDDGHGGWLIGGTRNCLGSDITVVSPGG